MKTSLVKEKPQDWHRADIKAALEKNGHTLLQLSKANNYAASIVGRALVQAYPACETIIAKAIGVTPQTIWPSRYNLDGTPKRLRTYPTTLSQKCTTDAGVDNVEVTAGN